MIGIKGKLIWNKLVGNKTQFSMENRVFSAINVITILVLLFTLPLAFYNRNFPLICTNVCLNIIVSILYYYSRVKKNYKTGIVIYGFICYAAIINTYYFDGGIKGPAFLYFGIIFFILTAISPARLSRLWVILHLGIASMLVFSEFLKPAMINYPYQGTLAYQVDVFLGFAALIIFVYVVTNYLTGYYNEQKQISDMRLQEILTQNEQILLQNQQLERINDEKNKLFSIVSHDLRAPIDSISGYLSVLSEDILDADDRKEIEQELHNQTKYTSDLLLNLLYWSKTQMNGVKANLYPVNLAEVVDDARNFQISTASKKGIKLTYNINNGIEVIADKDMLRIVLRNVINNAIKFTKPGGEVVIMLDIKNKLGEISIKDNGIGMHDDKQKEIFTLKASSTYGTKEEKGVGLGLMLCKEFMLYQNGDIAFESKIGQGSIFYMTLPLASSN